MNHKVYYFSSDNGEREFVVISDQDKADVIAEHGEGVCFCGVLELDGNATSWPCDRPLNKD